MKKLIYSLTLFMLFSLAFAYEIQIYQWKDLNATTPYINDFMICYLTNGTETFWDDYKSGVANILVDNTTKYQLYELFCCDNCHFDGNTLYLSEISLHYKLGTINITGDMRLDYYVGDIIEEQRNVNSGVTVADQKHFGGIPMAFWIMLIFPLGLGFFMAFIFDSMNAFVIGAGLGLILSFLYLWFSGEVSVLLLVIILLMFLGVVFSWGRMQQITGR